MAMALARDEYRYLETLAKRLGDAGYAPAIPVLAQLWGECALVPVRIAAGHALLKMRKAEAWDALEAMIDGPDHFSVFLGIKAVFERDPSAAYGYFASRFAEGGTGSPVPSQVLRLLAPCGWSVGGTPLWHDNARDWLKQEPRWLLLCARLRRDQTLGCEARNVLRNAPPPDRMAAMESVRREEAKDFRTSQPSVLRIGNLLARYEKGDFENVWREIRSHPEIGGDFRAEVQEVAEVAMRRVARNADMLAARLHERGWRALPLPDDRLRTGPSPEDEDIFQSIGKITASPVPPSLLAFWRIVGGINFVWDYESEMPPPGFGTDLPLDEMDPLCICPPVAIAYEFETWEEQKAEPDPDLIEPFRIDLAPDHLHKANVSGGAPYGVELPFWGADPILAGERHGLPFIDYLRMSFRWAGFPGLQYCKDGSGAAQFVSQLGAGLEPF